MTLSMIGQGIAITLLLWIGSFVLAAILAVPVAAARRSRGRVVRGIGAVWVAIARGIPPVVWLFILFFGVKFGPTSASPVVAAIVGLGLVNSAYLGDSIRAGLDSVARGQWEATTALGLPRRISYVKVILPQAIPIILASSASYSISLVKNTALASLIGANEILYYANNAVQLGANGLTTYLLVGAIYLMITIPLGFFARGIEGQMTKPRMV